MAITDIIFEIKTNIDEYKDLLLKAERQIKELKPTLEKIINTRLEIELIPAEEESINAAEKENS